METELLSIGVWKDLEAETEETGQNFIPSLYVCLSYKSNFVTTLHFRKVTFILRKANENYVYHTHARGTFMIHLASTAMATALLAEAFCLLFQDST